MQLHFYTAFENVELLEQGKVIQVWNKSEATETDIHISIDTETYNIFRTPMKTVFKVSKKLWKVNK